MLVIFDCDGVLVDSEPIAFGCDLAAVRALGLGWDQSECTRRFLGRSTRSCIEIVEAELGRPVPANWADDLHAATLAAFRAQGVPAVPGIAAVLDTLEAAKVPYCVASSGEIAKMRVTLGSAGLWPRFERQLFSSTMVARGKPAPDLFLHAAGAMGAAAGDCVVVEDAVAGVQAGVAAGMRVLAYVGGAYADRAGLKQAGAELFDDMARLPRLLGLAALPSPAYSPGP